MQNKRFIYYMFGATLFFFFSLYNSIVESIKQEHPKFIISLSIYTIFLLLNLIIIYLTIKFNFWVLYLLFGLGNIPLLIIAFELWPIGIASNLAIGLIQLNGSGAFLFLGMKDRKE